MKLRFQSRSWATVALWVVFGMTALLGVATFTPVYRLLAKPLVRDDAPVAADTIIVLGGGVVTDTKTLPWGVQERVQRGIELWRQGYAPQLILSGGAVPGHGYTESEIMRQYALDLGVPDSQLIEEDDSHSTRENALNSLAIMQRGHWTTALVVTSDYHTQRACRTFAKVGIGTTCIAAYVMPGYEHNYFRTFTQTRAIVRDYLATVYYWVRGY